MVAVKDIAEGWPLRHKDNAWSQNVSTRLLQASQPMNRSTMTYNDFDMARAVEHGAGAAGPQAEAAVGAKVEKARRPALQDSVTEADWVWFKECWRRYKAKTKIEGDAIVNELWECCTFEKVKKSENFTR